MNSTASVGDNEKEGIVLVDHDLTPELLADFFNQKINNTSPKIELHKDSDSNRSLVSEKWFDLKTVFRPTKLFKVAPKKNEFLSIQKWEGIVESFDEDKSTFVATVIDLTGSDRKKGIVEFDVDEVDPGDWDLISEGAIFYWNIGYQYSQGVRTKSSLIRFSRLPAWRKNFIEAIKVKAKNRFSSFKHNQP